MNPARRRSLILELLRKGPVPNQQELAVRLQEVGVVATQTTLSRDLASIGAVRNSSGYHPPDASTPGNAGPASDDLGGLVLGAEVGTTLLVLRTPAAHAHPVAQRIDALHDPSILGTIAGDDTVFVATSDQRSARRLAAELFPTGTTAGDA